MTIDLYDYMTVTHIILDKFLRTWHGDPKTLTFALLTMDGSSTKPYRLSKQLRRLIVTDGNHNRRNTAQFAAINSMKPMKEVNDSSIRHGKTNNRSSPALQEMGGITTHYPQQKVYGFEFTTINQYNIMIIMIVICWCFQPRIQPHIQTLHERLYFVSCWWRPHLPRRLGTAQWKFMVWLVQIFGMYP